MALTITSGSRAAPTPAAPEPTNRDAGACATGANPFGGKASTPFDRTAMEMAWLVYHEPTGPGGLPRAQAIADFQQRTGWHEMSAAELKAAGYSDAEVQRLYQPDHQFRAAIFSDGQGHYAMAFRGTGSGVDKEDHGADWKTNLDQGLGKTTVEYDQIVPQVARDFVNRLGAPDCNGQPGTGNLVLTGHSQGGGEAAFASATTGVPAVTFDAAGVANQTLLRHGLDPAAVRQSASDGQIRNYTIDGEALNTVETTGPYPSLTSLALPFTLPFVTAGDTALGQVMPDPLGHTVDLRYHGGDLSGRAISYMTRNEQTGQPSLSPLEGTVISAGARLLLGPVGNDAMNVADSAYKHQQQVMLDALDQNHPWNPSPTPTQLVQHALGGVNGRIDGVQQQASRNAAHVHGPLGTIERASVAVDNVVVDAVQAVGTGGIETTVEVTQFATDAARRVVDIYAPGLRPLFL